jgi:hypothetical protein
MDDGSYIVFVELDRNESAPNDIMSLMEDLLIDYSCVDTGVFVYDKHDCVIQHLPFAVSASKISEFFQCQEKFYQNYVKKSIKFVDTPATLEGKKAHTICENYINSNGATSLDGINDYMKDVLKKIMAAPGIKQAEPIFGFHNNLTEVKPLFKIWDKQSNKRPFEITGAMDVRVRNGVNTTILDFKTGKIKRSESKNPIIQCVESGEIQLKIYALAEFLENPNCQNIKTIFVHSKYNTMTSKIYVREQLPEMYKEVKYLYDMIRYWYSVWYIDDKYIQTNLTGLCSYCGFSDRCYSYQQTQPASELVLA